MVMDSQVVLLPGMHGTGELFGPLRAEIPAAIDVITVDYPVGAASFNELVDGIARKLPTDRQYVLVAESFAGPAAIRIAGQRPKNLRGLVLAATYLKSPRPWLRYLPVGFLSQFLKQFPINEWVVKSVLVGKGAEAKLVADIVDCLNRADKREIAKRIAMLAEIDVTDDFGRIRVPVTYLWPTADRLLPSRSADFFRARATSFVSVSSGHLMLQASPAESWLEIAKLVLYK